MAQEESYISGALDTAEKGLTKGVTGTVLDIVKKVGGSTLQVIGDKRNAAQASKKYVDRYEKLYGLIKLLGMPQGVSPKSVYTPVRVLNESSIRQFETISNLNEERNIFLAA